MQESQSPVLRTAKVEACWAGVVAVWLCAVVGWGCEKPVSLDLEKTEPQIVIQGTVTDLGLPCIVHVSKTRDFAQSGPFPAVSAAKVVISDDAGWVDTLTSSGDGLYVSDPMQGIAGRRYVLQVTVEGKEYTAVTTMPPKVRLDSITASPILEFNGRNGYDIDAIFKDPPAAGNCYRLEFAAGARWLEESFKWGQIILTDDQIGNGGELAYRFRASKKIYPGDTLTVALMSLDATAYQYFSTLNNIIVSVENPVPINPGNPVTNLSNEALGYFVAYAVDSKSIVLQ